MSRLSGPFSEITSGAGPTSIAGARQALAGADGRMARRLPVSLQQRPLISHPSWHGAISIRVAQPGWCAMASVFWPARFSRAGEGVHSLWPTTTT